MERHDLVRSELLKVCDRFIMDRISVLEIAVTNAQASAASETKSSMGDKYETARAMAQQEADHSRSQLGEAIALKNLLDQCPAKAPGETVSTGSIVYTNQHRYFIAIPIGAVQIGEHTFFVISRMSPIGKLLMGKRAGDQFAWQGNPITIERVL